MKLIGLTEYNRTLRIDIMFNFKEGDKVRLKKKPESIRAIGYIKKLSNQELIIDHFCTCAGCVNSNYGREIFFTIGGFWANEIDIEFAKDRIFCPPKNELEWMERVQRNFKE